MITIIKYFGIIILSCFGVFILITLLISMVKEIINQVRK